MSNPFHLSIQVLKLSITVRVIGTFFGLPIALQAVAERMEQIRDHLVTHRMLHPLQFGRQLPDTLARPTKRTLGVTSSGRFQ